jgi:hypothetical protein
MLVRELEFPNLLIVGAGNPIPAPTEILYFSLRPTFVSGIQFSRPISRYRQDSSSIRTESSDAMTFLKGGPNTRLPWFLTTLKGLRYRLRDRVSGGNSCDQPKPLISPPRTG